jgi:hypothetical protein
MRPAAALIGPPVVQALWVKFLLHFFADPPGARGAVHPGLFNVVVVDCNMRGRVSARRISADRPGLS